jgi:hypothetical protein
MTEPDDARIGRLTALARKAWPDEDAQIGNPKGKDPEKAGVFVASSEWTLLGVAAHPRALDALEAALLVLAGVDGLLSPLRAVKAQEQLERIRALMGTEVWEASLYDKVYAILNPGEGT